MAIFYIRGKLGAGSTPETCTCSCAQLISNVCETCSTPDDPCNDFCGTRTANFVVVADPACSWSIPNLKRTCTGCDTDGIAASGTGNGSGTVTYRSVAGSSTGSFSSSSCCFDVAAMPDIDCTSFSVTIFNVSFSYDIAACNFAVAVKDCSGAINIDANVLLEVDGSSGNIPSGGCCTCSPGFSDSVNVFISSIDFVSPQGCTSVDLVGEDFCAYGVKVANPAGQSVNIIYDVYVGGQCCCADTYNNSEPYTLPNEPPTFDPLNIYYGVFDGSDTNFFNTLTIEGTIQVAAGPLTLPSINWSGEGIYPFYNSTYGGFCLRITDSDNVQVLEQVCGEPNGFSSYFNPCSSAGIYLSPVSFVPPPNKKFFTFNVKFGISTLGGGYDACSPCSEHLSYSETLGVAVKKCVYQSTYSGGSWSTPSLVVDTFVDTLAEEAAESINLDTYTSAWTCIGTNLAEYVSYGAYLDMAATCGTPPACTLSPCP